MRILADAHGRSFQYLRLSITEACNFRCVYCLPEGYRRSATAHTPLSVAEIENLVAAFAEMGVWKVRLTGGEPTLRRDLLQIIERIAGVAGIREVALSTNGYRLCQLAPALRPAGLTALNVSVDSLDRDRFRQISGHDKLRDVLAGINAALEAGFAKIKINTVLLRGINDHEIDSFFDWTRKSPIHARFIELMRTGGNGALFGARHLGAGEIRLRLLRSGWRVSERGPGQGPAVEFEKAGFQGRVGIIAPYSEDFCSTCNRLRVSSAGALRLCLFGEKNIPLRPLLRSPGLRDELIECLSVALHLKPKSHFLKEGLHGQTYNLSAIGG